MQLLCYYYSNNDSTATCYFWYICTSYSFVVRVQVRFATLEKVASCSKMAQSPPSQLSCTDHEATLMCVARKKNLPKFDISSRCNCV